MLSNDIPISFQPTSSEIIGNLRHSCITYTLCSSTTRSPAGMLKLNEYICNLLNEKKAENVLCLDVSKKSNFADCIIIASGTSSRHIHSLAMYLMRELKAFVLNVEGLNSGEWILIDAGDVIVHLFKAEARIFYNLEQMWGEKDTSPTLSL